MILDHLADEAAVVDGQKPPPPDDGGGFALHRI
jgi:hypothetical protein